MMNFYILIFNLVINLSLLALGNELYRNGYHRPTKTNTKPTKINPKIVNPFRIHYSKICTKHDIVGHLTVDQTQYPFWLFEAKAKNQPIVIWVHETFGESSFLTFKTRDNFPCNFIDNKLVYNQNNWIENDNINLVLVDLPYHRGMNQNFKATSSQLAGFMNQLVLAYDLPTNTTLHLMTRREGAQIVIRAAKKHTETTKKLFHLKSIIIEDPYLSADPQSITESDSSDILHYFQTPWIQHELDYTIQNHTDNSLAPNDYDDLTFYTQSIQDHHITTQTLPSDQGWPSTLSKYL